VTVVSIKEPITVRWKGWTDDGYGSKMWMYYLELHKLEVKDATLELTERNPIKPMASNQTLHMGNMSHYQTFTPLEPGMYRYVLIISPPNTVNHIGIRFLFYHTLVAGSVHFKAARNLTLKYHRQLLNLLDSLTKLYKMTLLIET
jgi:uncharacterized protein involved in high-affinity Fe2+ transport